MQCHISESEVNRMLWGVVMELQYGIIKVPNGTAAATLMEHGGQNQTSWELCLLNINSCMTEAGTAGGKTQLQGEGPSMQVRKNLEVLLAPQQ